MKRVVHVLNDLSTFFTHRKSLIDFLRKDFDVIILAPDHLNLSPLITQGYDVRPYRLSRKGINPFTEVQTFLGLLRHYRSLKPDIVHHFTIKPVIYGSIAGRMAGIPRIVNTITGLGYVFTGQGPLPKMLRPLIKWLYRTALRAQNVAVIFQNHDDQKLFIDSSLIRPSNSTLIPGSGVNTDKFSEVAEPPAPPIKVVLPARMLWDKGIKEFVDAARIVRELRHDIEFELVGGLDLGNRMAIPETTLLEWQREGVVRWRGKSNDMVSIYHGCHIVCLPSYREGLPMALLEAASCGKAIITTDAPGCREVVENGASGILVPIGQSESLAEAIFKLGSDKDSRSRLGATARDSVVQTASSAIVNQRVGEYYEV